MFEEVYIEPTTMCNLECMVCRRDVPRLNMSLETFREILQRLREWGNPKYLVFFWRGESTLNPQLPEMVAEATEYGIYTELSTNATTLARKEYTAKLLSNLDRLELCIDGYNQETIERYRRGISYEAVVRSLQTVASVESNTIREMRVLMFKWNDGMEDFYREMAKKYAIDILSFGVPAIPSFDPSRNKLLATVDKGIVENFMSGQSKFQRYEKLEEDAWILKSAPECSFNPGAVAIIGADGTLYPCGMDWYGQFPLGNILSDSLKDITSRIEKIKPLMEKKKLPICAGYCCATDETVNYPELINRKLYKKLIASSLSKSRNISSLLFRLRRGASLLKGVYT